MRRAMTSDMAGPSTMRSTRLPAVNRRLEGSRKERTLLIMLFLFALFSKDESYDFTAAV
jgi:hypothetical protein